MLSIPAESHTLEENSDPAMIQWPPRGGGSAGRPTVPSYSPTTSGKGPVESIEVARGAKALTDSARIGLLLSTGTEKEAEDLGVLPETRLQYVRLDDAKAKHGAAST